MQYTISHRMSDVHGSAIRELFKLGADPSMISFGGGNPSAETFPVPEITEIMADVMKNAPVSVLQYGLSEGYTPLRDTMKEYLARTQGFDFEKNELFIVSGGQQCADLTTKVLVNEGDVILTEDPAFVGCLNTFRSYGAKLVGVPMQQDGMDIDALEAALKANPNAKLLYTIPSFQNPSGITTTLEKRKKVYELACRYDIAILEDNPYGELRFDGEDVPTIKSLDRGGQVLYCSSFSKILSAGMRVGFLCGHKDLIRKIVVVKQVNDVHTNIFFQMLASRFMEVYGLDEHIASIRALYKRKSALMVEALEEQLGGVLEIVRPQGGLFIWGTLPDKYDSAVFAKKAIGNMVAVVEGKTFAPDQSVVSHSFRMNYSTPTDEQIVEGVRRLRKTLDQYDA